jgi:hypothetical protein
VQEPAHRPTIYLVGVAGNPNLGDELIVAAWLDHLAEHLPDADVWLDTPYPGPAATLLAGRHPHLHVTDTLFRLRDRAAEEGVADAGEFVVDCLADPGKTPWWTSGIDLLKGADVVHLVGGGYANDMWPANLALFDALGWLARHTRARVGVTGVGLLPLGAENAARVARAAESLTVLDVRDPGTADALLRHAVHPLPLRMTGDDVLLQRPAALLDPHGAQAFDVGVVVQHDLREVDWPELVAFVRHQITAWGVAPERVAVVEAIPRLDAFIYDSLREEWPGVQLVSFQQAWRNGLPAGPHQRWISTRYHPHLIAAMGGATGVAISVRPDYYDAKHRLVRAAGSGWSLRNNALAEIGAAEPAELSHRLPRLRAAKAETARVLYGPLLPAPAPAPAQPLRHRLWALAARTVSATDRLRALSRRL